MRIFNNLVEGDKKGMVRDNIIHNFPISPANITNARAIFGPGLASIRGKMVQRTPAPMVADYVDVPRSVVAANKIVTMVADIFFVDKMAFLITASWRIKFVTAEHLQIRTALNLSKHLTKFA
jgi:hypothetical protein